MPTNFIIRRALTQRSEHNISWFIIYDNVLWLFVTLFYTHTHKSQWHMILRQKKTCLGGRRRKTADNSSLGTRTTWANIKIPHSGRLLYGNWAIWGSAKGDDVIKRMCNMTKVSHKFLAHNGTAVCEKLIPDFRHGEKTSAKRFQRACSFRDSRYCLNDDMEKAIGGVTIYVNSELCATCACETSSEASQIGLRWIANPISWLILNSFAQLVVWMGIWSDAITEQDRFSDHKLKCA